jgi:hypothetical protein
MELVRRAFAEGCLVLAKENDASDKLRAIALVT